MHRLRSHRIGVAQGEVVLFSDFENGGVMWTGEGPRQSRDVVTFDEPFRAPPMVQVGLSMWDISRNANARVDVRAIEISASGFVIDFRTWGDTKIARIRVSWSAIGELADADDWNLD